MRYANPAKGRQRQDVDIAVTLRCALAPATKHITVISLLDLVVPPIDG